MTFCAIGLTNAKLYEKSLMESRRSRVSKSLKFDRLLNWCVMKLLLDLAKKLFEDQTSLDRMVTKIMMQATELVKCERCTVLLLDTNNQVKIALLFTLDVTNFLCRT